MPDDRDDATTLARQDIAEAVRQEMGNKGKTQRELGKVLHLTQPSVHLRLKGERPFRGDELVLIAEFLDVPVERFMRPPAVTQ